MWRSDQKCIAFKIAKRMVQIIHDIIRKQSIRNNDGVLVVGNENEKRSEKSYHENLLNTELAWERNSLLQPDIVSSVPRFNRQRHDQRVNESDENCKGCWIISCSVRNGKGNSRSMNLHDDRPMKSD